jgi:hypothetical protein
MSESRVRENCTHGWKRRGLESERQPPRQSPTLLRLEEFEQLMSELVGRRCAAKVAGTDV